MARPGSLSPELRALVDETVTTLGDVVRERLGARSFGRIERARSRLARLRGASTERATRELRALRRELARLPRQERLDFARAFALMLELMNACENAYRSRRIGERLAKGTSSAARPDTIIYVLTAHPTEARSPENIWIFHEIERVLAARLARGARDGEAHAELRHWIEVAWLAPAMRRRKPRVLDEADHIYSTLLREETLRALLRAGREIAPVYIRSWVGGDKDGHPGVDERAFVGSLQRSRALIAAFAARRIAAARPAIEALVRGTPRGRVLARRLAEATRALRRARRLLDGDGARVLELRAAIHALAEAYRDVAGARHPELEELVLLGRVFPAYVVPLEFRESSDLILDATSGARGRRPSAIERMLATLARVAGSRVDPRWYVRGLIISMAESIEHVRAAARLVSRALGGRVRIPVIPLFEQGAALSRADRIAREMLDDRGIARALRAHWGNHLEVMLGYSDSAKESGVLPSRLRIAEAMHAVDRLVTSRGARPIFFQGSGGSVDRGGGTIPEQTAWWSPSALRNFKVTLQGEVVERSFASPEILRGQLERVVESAGRWPKARIGRRTSRELERFAARVAATYRATIASPDFLRVVEQATPYRSLDALKIGSRPTKRTATLSVAGLRAIPWVLCWTQTRVLFPTWWGIGSAWRETPARERQALRRAYSRDPVFATYVRALGFTLSKVELPVWRIYLEESRLPEDVVRESFRAFEAELESAREFAHAMLGRELLGWRPWLAESIRLRAPMIHPLNLLQTIALRERDPELLRMTMLGISGGMMSTG